MSNMLTVAAAALEQVYWYILGVSEYLRATTVDRAGNFYIVESYIVQKFHATNTHTPQLHTNARYKRHNAKHTFSDTSILLLPSQHLLHRSRPPNIVLTPPHERQ